MFNETALSWAIISKWLETRGDFYDIIGIYGGYCARFRGIPNRTFDGKTILAALQLAYISLEAQKGEKPCTRK